MALAIPEDDVRLVEMVVLSALVGVAGCDRQSAAPVQPVKEASEATPEAATATVAMDHRGETAPDIEFDAPDGSKVTLAKFRGKPVLLNLWATWCGPCVAEMPTLDKVATNMVGKLQVITVSQDMKGKALVDPWWATKSFKTIQPYVDAKGDFGFALNTGILPTTILYDAGGKEVWRSVGGMDWTGPRANTLLAQAVGG